MILDVIAELADGWNYWDLDKKEIVARENYLFAKCVEAGRSQTNLVESWAGKVDATGQRSSKLTLVEDIQGQLLSKTSEHVDYFIASFGCGSDRKAYEAFAEAVKSIA